MKNTQEKKQKKSADKNAGRKWFDGKNEKYVIAKLKRAWEFGATDREAAVYAKISKDSVSRYLQAHPELRDKKELLKDSPILLARKAVIANLSKNNFEAARWYLTKKKKDEFGDDKEKIIPDSLSLNINLLSKQLNLNPDDFEKSKIPETTRKIAEFITAGKSADFEGDNSSS